MKLKIPTSKGNYLYRFIPIYPGIKPIDKEKARENLNDSGNDIYFELCAAFCGKCDAHYGGLLTCSACYCLECYFITVFSSGVFIN